jgi:hypothetical protein
MSVFRAMLLRSPVGIRPVARSSGSLSLMTQEFLLRAEVADLCSLYDLRASSAT